MSRIKEQRLIGEGEDGQDLLRHTDIVTGDIIKEVSVRPIAEEEKSRKIIKSREVIADKPLISAEEMTKIAIKAQNDTAGKKVRELIRNMLDTAEKNVLSGSYSEFLDATEVPTSVVKNIIYTLKGLGYKVKKTAKEGGTDIKISWSTKKTEAKEKTSTGKKKYLRSRPEPGAKEPTAAAIFEFEKTKT